MCYIISQLHLMNLQQLGNTAIPDHASRYSIPTVKNAMISDQQPVKPISNSAVYIL